MNTFASSKETYAPIRLVVNSRTREAVRSGARPLTSMPGYGCPIWVGGVEAVWRAPQMVGCVCRPSPAGDPSCSDDLQSVGRRRTDPRGSTGQRRGRMPGSEPAEMFVFGIWREVAGLRAGRFTASARTGTLVITLMTDGFLPAAESLPLVSRPRPGWPTSWSRNGRPATSWPVPFDAPGTGVNGPGAGQTFTPAPRGRSAAYKGRPDGLVRRAPRSRSARGTLTSPTAQPVRPSPIRL